MTREQATAFIRLCVTDLVGNGFHPDSDFADYIYSDTGKTMFPVIFAADLNALLVEAFTVLGDGVYDVGLDAQNAQVA